MTNPGRHKRNTEILSMLLEKADIQGYLTTEDLMEVYPNVTEDREPLGGHSGRAAPPRGGHSRPGRG